MRTEPDDRTVAVLLAEWQALRAPDWAPSTIATHASICRTLTSHIGERRVDALRPFDVDALYEDMRLGRHPHRGEISPASLSAIARSHAVFGSALQQAVRWGWIESNPARATRRPRPPVHRAFNLDSAGLVRIVRTVPPHSNFGVLVRVALVTGARRGELCALRANDLHPDKRTVRVARAISIGQGSTRVERSTKTRNVRLVTIDAVTMGSLMALLDDRAAMAERNGYRRIRNPFVFSPILPGNRPIGPNSVTSLWRRWRRRAAPDGSLDHINFTDLRHHCISASLASGVPITTVAARAGHSDPATTLRWYGHALPAHDGGAADVLAAVLDQPRV